MLGEPLRPFLPKLVVLRHGSSTAAQIRWIVLRWNVSLSKVSLLNFVDVILHELLVVSFTSNPVKGHGTIRPIFPSFPSFTKIDW